MRVRSVWLMAFLFLFNAPALLAEEQEDKLDAILKEIKLLNQRVSELEVKVQRLATEEPGPHDPTKALAPRPIPESEIRRLERYPDVEGVFQLQRISPGSLLEGIHHRERILRQRSFPAEIFRQPPLIITNR